jgi:hypothetical protein
LRFLFDHFQSDALFNRLLGTKPVRRAAGIVYFHHKGAFDPSADTARRRASESPEKISSRR